MSNTFNRCFKLLYLALKPHKDNYRLFNVFDQFLNIGTILLLVDADLFSRTNRPHYSRDVIFVESLKCLINGVELIKHPYEESLVIEKTTLYLPDDFVQLFPRDIVIKTPPRLLLDLWYLRKRTSLVIILLQTGHCRLEVVSFDFKRKLFHYIQSSLKQVIKVGLDLGQDIIVVHDIAICLFVYGLK